MRKHIFLWTSEYRLNDIHTNGKIEIAGDGEGQIFLYVDNNGAETTTINLMGISRIEVDTRALVIEVDTQ
jgi:hypothetical protein